MYIVVTTTRPKIFDLQIRRPDLLYEYVCEVNERVLLVKDDSPGRDPSRDVVLGVSGEHLFVETPLEAEEVARALGEVAERGIRYAKSTHIIIRPAYPTHATPF